MQHIRTKIWSNKSQETLKREYSSAVRVGTPSRIKTYKELASQIADLSYNNAEHFLFFRGQQKVYSIQTESGKESSFYPSIYRNGNNIDIPARFDTLEEKTNKLKVLFKKKIS